MIILLSIGYFQLQNVQINGTKINKIEIREWETW